MAVALIVHAKKGMSAKQVQRHLGVNYRTAVLFLKRMKSGEPIMSDRGRKQKLDRERQAGV